MEPDRKLEATLPTQEIIPVCDTKLTESARDVSKEYVFDVYDKIAPHFSHTRYKVWPKVGEFVQCLPAGSFLMDAGCGNGKNLVAVPNAVRFASDRSLPFCEIARKSGQCDALQCDIARDIGKSFRPHLFDAVIAIAVLHHIPTLEGRVGSLKEMHRLLKPGGRALVYVWAMEQEKGSVGARTFDSQDIYVPWNLQSKYLSPEEGIPLGKIVSLKRYYHVFKEEEVRELIESVPEFKLVNMYFDHNNWAVELEALPIV